MIFSTFQTPQHGLPPLHEINSEMEAQATKMNYSTMYKKGKTTV